jgi:hypothetical protein
VESGIFLLISDLVSSGVLSDTTLLLILIAIMGLMYKYIFRPMQRKMDVLIDKAQLDRVVNDLELSTCEKVEELSKKLEELLNVIDHIEEFGKDNSREILNIKHDVEQIKQILNQFQGHLMYGNRMSSDFGNKELK